MVLLIVMAVLRLELCEGWKGELALSVWFWKKVEFYVINGTEFLRLSGLEVDIYDYPASYVTQIIFFATILSAFFRS